MRIEEISVDTIEKASMNDLYQLRLRSKQFFDKYIEFEKENLFIAVDWDKFFDRYGILISEFRNRNIRVGKWELVGKWSLDEELRKRITKVQDFYIKVLGSIAQSHSVLGKHFSLLVSHRGKNVLIDPAVHRSVIDEDINAIIITQSDKDHWEYIKEYDKIPVYSIGAVLDKLPPNDFHPILKPLVFDGLTLIPIKTTHKVDIPSMGVRMDVGVLRFSVIPEFMTLDLPAKNLIKDTIWLMGAGNYDEDDETTDNLSFKNLIELAKELKPKAIYLTNLRKDLLKHEDEVNKVLKEWKGKILKDNSILKYEDFIEKENKINALVVGKHRIAKEGDSVDSYNYILACGGISKEWAEAVEKEDKNAVIKFKDKFYNVIGKSKNTDCDVAKGSILRILVEGVDRYETANAEFYYYKNHIGMSVQSVPENESLDGIEVLEHLIKQILQKETLVKKGINEDVKTSIQNKKISKEIYDKYAKENEPLPKEFYPDYKEGVVFSQFHIRGLEPEETKEWKRKKISLAELIQGHSLHCDLRMQFDDKLIQWVLTEDSIESYFNALKGKIDPKTGNVDKALCLVKLSTEEPSKILVKSKEVLLSLSNAKKVADLILLENSYIIKAGGVGATKYKDAFMGTFFIGKVKAGLQREDLHEQFFYPSECKDKEILNGRYIIRCFKEVKRWWFWKTSKDPLPMDTIEHKAQRGSYFPVSANEVKHFGRADYGEADLVG